MSQQEAILVTGGAGFIGSAFIRYLLLREKSSAIIVNLDLLTYAGNLQNTGEFSHFPNYHFVQGDIQNADLLEELWQKFRFTLIVHFAAESHVDRSIADPMQFLHTNIYGTMQLLQLVRRHPSMHFHHISTDEVFGSLHEHEEAFSESSPYQPNSPYSASKASSDHFVRAFHQTYGISTSLSYCSNNFGPYQHLEKFIPLLIASMDQEKPLPIYGNGQQIRDWIYVDDHIKAIWQIVQRRKPGDCFAIAAKNEYRNLTIVEMLIEIFVEEFGKRRESLTDLIRHVSDRPGHDYRYALTVDRIYRQLAWQPAKDFYSRLRETVSWYMDRKPWNSHRLSETPCSSGKI